MEGRGITFQQISDGLSNTILIGEKHVPQKGFGKGPLDGCVYNGDNPASWSRGAGLGMGLAHDRDTPEWLFGAYHFGLCQFALCDGSVQRMSNSLDPNTLSLLCTRSDGQVIPPYE